MAILPILMHPDDRLNQIAIPISEIDDKIKQLAKDMLATMKANHGVGLAGPQVGVNRRIFVAQEPNGPPLCFINPEIVDQRGSRIDNVGCLSFPGTYLIIARPTWIRVSMLGLDGVKKDYIAEDLLARIVSHEIEHLDGKTLHNYMNLSAPDDPRMEKQWRDDINHGSKWIR